MRLYFKLCLLSPLWLPAVLLLVAWLFQLFVVDAQNGLPDWLSGVYITLIASVFFGGIQYCVALFVIWVRIDFDQVRSWMRGALLIPIVFAPIQLLGMLPFLLPDLFTFEGWGALGGLALCDLLVGYGYVLFWFIGLGLIQGVRRIQEGVFA